jgi:hypothetical protein
MATTRMVGVVTNGQRGSGGEVVSFQLLASTSDDHATWWIDPARDYGFDLSHLDVHLATGDPVVVVGSMQASRLVALSIEDA